MKMFMILAAAAVSFAGVQAQAGFEGSYKGTGKVYDSTGFKKNCETMTVQVDQTATTLKVSTSFTCGGMKLDAPGGALEIKGGKLLKNGQAVGSISNDAVTINEVDGETSLKTDAKLAGNILTFKVVTTSPARPGVKITYEGTVKR